MVKHTLKSHVKGVAGLSLVLIPYSTAFRRILHIKNKNVKVQGFQNTIPVYNKIYSNAQGNLEAIEFELFYLPLTCWTFESF